MKHPNRAIVDATFSELRSICSGISSRAAFTRLIRICVSAWQVSPHEAQEKLVPYLEVALERWPDEDRCLRTYRALGTPFVALARGVDLSGLVLSEYDLSVLWEEPHISGLETLDLSDNALSLDDIDRQLERSGVSLRSLDFCGNERSWRSGLNLGMDHHAHHPEFHGVRPETIANLARARATRGLEQLGVRFPCDLPRGHNDTGGKPLAEEVYDVLAQRPSPWPRLHTLSVQAEGTLRREPLERAHELLHQLTSLKLESSCPLSFSIPREAVTPRCPMPALEILELIGPCAGMALADANPQTLTGLSRLTIARKSSPLWRLDTQPPIAWPAVEHLQDVRHLRLARHNLDEGGAFQALLTVLGELSLESLELEHCNLDDVKVRALIDTLDLERLRCLKLGELRFEVTPDTIEALLSRCDGLEELSLVGLFGSDRLATALCRVMPENLRALDLSGWYALRLDALERVLCSPPLQRLERLRIGRQQPWHPDQTMFVWFFHPFERVFEERALPNLRVLHAGDAIAPKLLAKASHWRDLEVVSFFDVETTPAALMQVLESKHFERLCEFSYLHGKFGMEAIEPMRHNEALAKFDRFVVEKKPGIPKPMTSLEDADVLAVGSTETSLLLDPTSGEYTRWRRHFGEYEPDPLPGCEERLRSRFGTSALAEPLCDRSVRASIEIAASTTITDRTAQLT